LVGANATPHNGVGRSAEFFNAVFPSCDGVLRPLDRESAFSSQLLIGVGKTIDRIRPLRWSPRAQNAFHIRCYLSPALTS
jgi:hypothetical protein